MPFLPDLNGEFCLRLTLTLLHFLWQGGAIALLAAGAGAALRRAGAAARYWVFVAALGAMALCPPITYHTLARLEDAPQEVVPPSALSPETVASQQGEETLPGRGGVSFAPVSPGNLSPDAGFPKTLDLSSGDEGKDSGTGVESGLKPAPTEKAASDASLLKRVSRAFTSDAYARVAPWVAGGYFVGVLAMLARLLLALRGGRGLRRHALPVTEPALRAMFERAAAVLHLRARPALAWCERVAVPTVVGLLKPTILLPVSLSSGLAPDQIEMLLLHELAHLRRHDHWVNLAQWIVETAMFFHPAVWWVSRRIRAERELACDDCVLAAGVAEASYADSLLRMAELSRLAMTPPDPTAALALGSHGSRFSEFGQRVLRLIEGREALESLRPARVWPVAVALGVLLVGCYAIACRPEVEDTRQSNDPLGIRYRGLQVGLSDSLYNPQGEKIGERLNWQYASGSLFSKEGKRRLVFDFPKTPEPIFFGSLQMFCGGTRAEKRAWRKKTKGLDRIPGGMELRTEMDGQTRQLIADFSGPSPRDHLDFPAVGDIALRYYYGPPGKSLYRFSAPFIQDREQRDQGGTLCPQENSLVKATNYSLAYFTLKLETPIEKAEDGSLGMAIAYDKAGKRYRGSILPREGAKSEDWFKDLEFSLNVPIGEIETITIGEKPYEVWVKGVQVTPPGSEDETRKEMTEIARVFEIPDMKYDQLFTYDFEADPDKALRSLSLFRGYPFNHALRAISSEKFQGQSPEFLEQLHQTALRLSQAPLPHWKDGIWMGFRGEWPEFYGLALDHLADPELQSFIAFYGEGGEGTRSFEIANFLSKHSQELSDDLVPKIEKAISVVDTLIEREILMKCLTDKKTSTTTEALLRLAKDERPWIWIFALKELSKRQALAPEESLTPPEKIRLGVVRALNGSWPDGVPLDPDVESALLTILSDGAKDLGPTYLLDALHRYGDPKTTLRTAVEFLQKQNPYGHRYNIWPILAVPRWINQNYGVDIGGLGTGSPNDLSYEEMPPSQLGQLITDTCTWYEQSEYFNGTPLKRPFFQNSPEEQAGETKDAPLDIRFAGIQVGLGDSLYNPNGEKIGERFNGVYIRTDRDDLNRRFVFDLPETTEPILFKKLQVFCGGTKAEQRAFRKKTNRDIVAGVNWDWLSVETNGTTQQLVADVPNWFRSEGQIYPAAVDVVLSYHSGPPGESLYRFSGPFETTQTLEDRGASLCLNPKAPMWDPPWVFVFSLKLPIALENPYEESVIIYDKDGGRHFGRLDSPFGANPFTHPEEYKKNLEIRLINIPVGEIASITIGEKPCEVWAKGIQVTPAGSEEETRNQLAEIARLLDTPGMNWEQIRHYDFRSNPDKALRCFPFLRGSSLAEAWGPISHKKWPDSSPELAEQFRQTVLKWAKAPVPHCQVGVLLGLKAGWPEFYPMALDLLAQQKKREASFNSRGIFFDPSFIASELEERRLDLPDDLPPRIQEVIGTTADNFVLRSLMKCLRDKKTSATTEALRSLAKDERPWLWIPALDEISKRQALPSEENLAPLEKVRLAVVRVLRNSSTEQIPHDPEVESMLLSLLANGSKWINSEDVSFSDLLKAIHRYCDPGKSIRAIVEFIQKLNPNGYKRDVLRILQMACWINLNYGTNIGGWGTDQGNVTYDKTPPRQFEKAIADTVAWYQNGLAAGGLVPKKPVVLEFPADRSIGTLQNETLGKFNMQGRLEIPAEADISVQIQERPESWAVLEQFKPFKRISLCLEYDGYRDDDLQHIRMLTSIQGLYIQRMKLTAAGLENLKDLTNLNFLRFEECQFEEGGLGSIQNCQGLQRLVLSGCPLSDTVLDSLRLPAGVHALSLERTPITDASIEALKRFTHLKNMSLDKTRMTPEGLDKLREFLPDCAISPPDAKMIYPPPPPTQPAQPQPQPKTGEKDGSGPAETTTTASASAAPPAFALYRLRSQLITAKEALEKPLAELELAETPLLTDADILTYYGPSHRIRLTAEAFARMPGAFTSQERASTYGTPFVITVQGERIYCGAFCTMISSQTGPDCPTIGDGFLYLHEEPRNTIAIGYNPKPQVPDPRADERIRNALERIGKYQAWYTPPTSTSLRVHKVAQDIEIDHPGVKQLPWRFPDSSRSTSVTALRILETGALLTVADLTTVTVVQTSPAGPFFVQIQFNRAARESVLLELQNDRPTRTVVRDGRTYYENVRESMGPPTPKDRYAHRLAVVQDGQILSAPIASEVLRSDWIPLVSLQSEDEAQALAESIAASLRAFLTPPQPEMGKGEAATSTTTTTIPVAPGEQGTGNTSTSQPLKVPLPSGPLDIRFAGLQVGLGDSLYNQKGEKIGEHVNWTVSGPYEETPSWRFIFDLPETGSDAQYFKMFLYRSDDGKRQERLRTFGSVSEFGLALIERNGRQTQWVIEDRATPSAYVPGKKPPRSVDLVMQYYSGPAGECQARFDGPFEIDKSQEDRGVTLCPRKDPSALPYSRNALFKLKSGSGLVMNTPVLIYDKEGRRYRGIGGSGSSGSAGSEREFRVEQISLEDIVLVTVGEKPLEFEMNGIRVDPAGAVEETEARLAQIAKALDLPSVTWNDLGQYNFATDREKTIRSLPFLQGGILVKAWQEFTNASDPLNPVNPKQFSPELVEIVHQTALKWSGVPAHCQFGIGMGLWGGWPEFYPMALDQRMGFDAIENHPQKMSEEQIPRILEILQTTENPKEYQALMSCLKGKRSTATTEALRALTRSDRPWLWVPAFIELWSRNVFTPDAELSPQDKVRLRTARVIRGGEPALTSGEEIEPLLLSMLTPEAKRMSGVYFDIFQVLNTIQICCNRENRTRAMVEFVQKADWDVRPLSWEIVHIVCWINRDYNVNISNLGTDPNKMSVPSQEQLKQLASDLAAWHKTGVVPGGFTAEKPVVLDFPEDSSLGTLQVGTKTSPAQGRVEIPVGSRVSLSIRQRPVSFASVEQLKVLKGFDIDLYGIRFSDDDFQYFRPLTNLRSLVPPALEMDFLMCEDV